MTTPLELNPAHMAQVPADVQPNVLQVLQAFDAVAAGAPVRNVNAMKVLEAEHYIDFDSATGMHTFTPKGIRFYKNMKKMR